MNRIYVLALLLIAFGGKASSQNSTPAFIAGKIAEKLRDTLALTDVQKDRVFAVNMQIYNCKRAARAQYSIDDAQLQVKIQEAENTRDSLYKEILTNTQYLLYKRKKPGLVNNNKS